MNERIMGRLRKKKAALQRYLETKDGKDYQEYARERNTMKHEVRRAVREYQREIAIRAKKKSKGFLQFC